MYIKNNISSVSLNTHMILKHFGLRQICVTITKILSSKLNVPVLTNKYINSGIV